MVDSNFSIAVRFGGSAVYLSEIDLPFFAASRWYVNGGYLKQSGTDRLFHRLVMGDPDGLLVDHISGQPLDNRRQNLRECSHSQNMQNRKTHKNNALGVKGVYAEYHKRVKGVRYVAQIRAYGRKIVLGRFNSIEDAAAAYRVAADRLHGEFARLS